MLNVEAVKSDFPILKSKTSKGKSLVYLDNAATTQKPQIVINAIEEYYTTQNANIHRGIYDLAAVATDLYELARHKVKDFIGAQDQSQIVFCKGTTEAVNLVGKSFVSPRLQAGDEIVVSMMEHHSNLVPWQMLCQKARAVLKVIPITQSGELKIDEAANLLTSKTKLLALVHISNTLGTINPITEIIRLAHKKDIPVLVDAAQSIGHQKIDVQALDCDFLAFSGHKMLGPMGIGILYAKTPHLEVMEPLQYGGEMVQSVTIEATSFKAPPHKFEGGTPNVGGAIALGQAIDYLQHIGMEAIADYTERLTEHALRKLQTIDGLRIIGQAKRRGSIISFTIDDIHSHDIASILNEEGIAIRAGHHCTQPLMQFYQLPGTARVSFACYNTAEEIDHLADTLKTVKKIMA
ncbi:MAG: aminotransferase class V-fold PLP-dependent enzyme [Cyclobacteriaceae bacterium]